MTTAPASAYALSADQAPQAAGVPRGTLVRRALVVTDVVSLALAAVIALALGAALAGAAPVAVGPQLVWALLYALTLPILINAYGLYDLDAKRVGHATLDEAPAVFHALLLGTLGLWGLLKLAGAGPLIFAQGLVFLVLGVVSMLGMRAATRRAVREIATPERVLLVGTGPSARLLADRISSDPRYRLVVVGYLADSGESPGSDLPWLGSPSDLQQACGAHAVQRVVFASPSLDGDRLATLVREANCAEVSVSLLPSVLDVLGTSTQLDDLNGVTMLGVNPVRFSRSSRLLKRGLDIAISATLLGLTLPLLPLVAAAIRLDSRGPVFFGQQRLGRGGRQFRLYKLRTMVADAEARAVELRGLSAHPAWLMLDHDPRVTRVGRLLRVTSIDELPQLWNVLRGDMSLVGPRPMPVDTDRHISGWGRRRLDLTPGITGLWQVLGRASIPFEEMLKLDYLYVTNWSVWGDIRLLLRTVHVVLARRGAN